MSFPGPPVLEHCAVGRLEPMRKTEGASAFVSMEDPGDPDVTDFHGQVGPSVLRAAEAGFQKAIAMFSSHGRRTFSDVQVMEPFRHGSSLTSGLFGGCGLWSSGFLTRKPVPVVSS